MTVMTEELLVFDYPTNEEIVNKITSQKTLHLEDLVEREYQYEVLDTYYGDGRIIPFNKQETLFNREIVINLTEQIDTDKVNAFLKSIPPFLLMNIENIIFINHCDELDKEELSENHSMHETVPALGMFVYMDNNIIIHVPRHIEAVKETQAEFEADGLHYNYDTELNRAILTTIGHELYHSASHNPFFDNDLADSENDSEEYGLLLAEKFSMNILK